MGLKRYYAQEYLHFLTCSCYHRQSWLATARRRDMFLQILEEWWVMWLCGELRYMKRKPATGLRGEKLWGKISGKIPSGLLFGRPTLCKKRKGWATRGAATVLRFRLESPITTDIH
jgi:hypothetical protein